MREDICESVCWMERYGRDATCDRPKDHEGEHRDYIEGWEW